MRTGLLGKKVGVTSLFDEFGLRVPVTVIDVNGCTVVGQRTQDKNGYTAVQLAFGKAKAKNVTKAVRGQFAKAQVEAKAKVVEFRVSQEALVEVGKELTAAHFLPGQYVDVTGKTVGKGFAGAMKRHNFRGLEASHGVSISHRSHGSTGGRQDPGRVFKNKKMAGHMGTNQVTIQNLEVAAVDAERGLLMVKGAIPGHEGAYVTIKDAVKKGVPSEVPFPAAVKQ